MNQYNECSKQIEADIKKRKLEFYRNRITQSMNNPKNMWKTVNEFSGRGSGGLRNGIDKITVHGKEMDGEEIFFFFFWIRQRTKVKVIAYTISHLKWDYFDYVARIRDETWKSKIIKWKPWIEKRGRSIMRWYHDIKRVAELNRIATAQNRKIWKESREAYAQIWVQKG
ncbi:hypothetical protein HHI36_000296 [Cryptolaemus montrouzieri]|uniref:Uncharacterized protein n=1 Tax=Cryptolaemus montrouzieri TaxID=559131 RepID=A0ABD2P476_9CUCU